MINNSIEDDRLFASLLIHRTLDHSLKHSLPTRKLSSLDYTIIYIFSGTGYLYIKHKMVSLQTGDFYVLNPMVEYYLQQDSSAYLHYLIIELNIYKQVYPLQYSPHGYHQVKGHRFLYEKIFHTILAIIKAIDPVPDFYLDYWVKGLLFLSYRCNVDLNGHGELALSHPEILKSKRYIDNNYTEPISLEALANLVNLSPSYFSRKFQEEIHESPRQYWLKKRLEHAEKLIKNTKIPLNKIAKQVGFNNYSHFSNQYKNKYGLSPRAFRNSESNND